ncbi:MAG: site-specific integrase [Devosia sp.]
MQTIKIIKKTVDAAELREQRYVIFDAVVPGFGLRVSPAGKKSWIFAYRPHPGGRDTPKKTALIGTPDDFTPDQARNLADNMRALVRTGGDPQAAKADQRSALTTTALATAFMEQHVEAKRGAATVASYRDILDRIVIPKLGKKKARDVTGRDMSALHQAWAATPYQANRILAVVSAMYGWAAGPVALVPAGMNPAKGIERFTEEKRGNVLSGDELERLGAAIRLAETDGIPWELRPDAKVKHRPKYADAMVTKIGPHAAAAIRMLIFTGMRLREMLGLRWSQIDFDQGLIVLTKHKTSRKTGSKAIVLNAPALAVLATLPRVGVYVIAGDTAGQKDEKPRSDIKRPWALVRQAAGMDDLRVHDLRHNFGGFGAGGGLGLPIIGKLLGHSQPATTARYSHLDADPVRRASDAIGKRLAAAMREPPPDEKNNVVPIKSKTA